jgi:hypothetical protein
LATSDSRKATLKNNGGSGLPTSDGDSPFHDKAGVDPVGKKATFQLPISNDDDRANSGMDPDNRKTTVKNNNNIKSELPTSDGDDIYPFRSKAIVNLDGGTVTLKNNGGIQQPTSHNDGTFRCKMSMDADGRKATL